MWFNHWITYHLRGGADTLNNRIVWKFGGAISMNRDMQRVFPIGWEEEEDNKWRCAVSFWSVDKIRFKWKHTHGQTVAHTEGNEKSGCWPESNIYLGICVCVCVCVSLEGISCFKWVKVRLASYYCLHSRSYIITVNCIMDRERERETETGRQMLTEKYRWGDEKEREEEKWRQRERERENSVKKKDEKKQARENIRGKWRSAASASFNFSFFQSIVSKSYFPANLEASKIHSTPYLKP